MYVSCIREQRKMSIGTIFSNGIQRSYEGSEMETAASCEASENSRWALLFVYQ